MDELARSHLAPLPSKPNARQVSEKGGREAEKRARGDGRRPQERRPAPRGWPRPRGTGEGEDGEAG